MAHKNKNVQIRLYTKKHTGAIQLSQGVFVINVCPQNTVENIVWCRISITDCLTSAQPFIFNQENYTFLINSIIHFASMCVSLGVQADKCHGLVYSAFIIELSILTETQSFQEDKTSSIFYPPSIISHLQLESDKVPVIVLQSQLDGGSSVPWPETKVLLILQFNIHNIILNYGKWNDAFHCNLAKNHPGLGV